MSKDYYKILGVEKGSSKEDIKKAYKKLAKKYHPDISKESNAETKFKEINEAAEVLLDDEKKQRYDTYGSADPQGFGGFGRGNSRSGGFNPSDFGINLDDIFEQFGFGSFGGGNSRNSNQSQKDTSEYIELEISLDDVYFGVKKEIKIKRNKKCKTCDGSGAKTKADLKTCSTCNGSGVVTEIQRSILGAIRTQRPCPNCNGTGNIISNPCEDCFGKGVINEKETIEISIPKGIENGMTLKVSEKGSYNTENKSYGDLYIKIFVKKHKDFEVDESDLYYNLNINFVQATLGDEIEFNHFNKTLSLTIPAGTQPGAILRLKNKGLPHFNYNSYGNLYVKVNVKIPKTTTNKQKEILMEYTKTLKDKSIFDRLKTFFK